MVTSIENQFLKVDISSTGAEMISFYNKSSKVEQLWQADPAIWPWHAPILFPIVGSLINDELSVDGSTYRMQRHGFGQQSEFSLIALDDIAVTFSLHYSEETLRMYPYKFELQVRYELIDSKIKISYRIVNHGTDIMHFSIGGHPAFNVPFHPNERYEDYYLEFEADESLERHMLSSEGLLTGDTQTVSLDMKKLHLSHPLFSDDALIFKSLHSRTVTIRSTLHNERLSLSFPDFSYLGIWAKPGADFVCIEPWLGCADTAGKAVDIAKKEAMQEVVPNTAFEVSFFVVY